MYTISHRARRVSGPFVIESAFGPAPAPKHGARAAAGLRILAILAVITAFLGINGPAAWAGTSGGICMVDRYNDLSQPGAPKSSLGCTSNDVQLATFSLYDGPTFCIAGDMINVRLQGSFTSGSDERYDVGIFISEDGSDPNATGSTCYSDYLNPVSADNADLDLTGGSGPYYNGEITEDGADSCGDIEQDENATFITDWFMIPCADSNQDAVADVGTCTVWANATSDGSAGKPSCQSENEVTADTTSKCTCETTNISGIEVREFATLEVVKNLEPNTDGGLFNLQIDGSDEATDVGNGGTTGAIQVSAGTSGNPGGAHTIRETAGTNTRLASYISSISCVDRGETTFDNGPALTQSGAGPLEVPVDPNDDIVCTITNTNGCETTICEDAACATFACDPTGVVGNCDSVTFLVGEVCRFGSGDSCDPDEVCVDQQFECPDDGIAEAGTVCRPGSGDLCDPDEVCSGVPGELCPDDTISDQGTVCNPGSGDLCDPDEVCSGVAGDACPDDSFDDGSAVCNPGSGDLCDPDEYCPGVADAACPDDVYANAGTVCDVGSGDLCDPDEVCSGVPDEACPDDSVADEGTLCRAGPENPDELDMMCDTPEFCTGVAEAACPPDDAPGNAGLVCREGNGVDICDLDELCTGVAGDGCPNDDALNNAGLVCRESGTGFEDCDPPEVCLGIPGSICPDDYVEPEDTPCGDPSTTQCTDPDTCDPYGVCLYNNKPCGSVTNSSLCEYDMEPTKGSCAGGPDDGEPCLIMDACVLGGGVCDSNLCLGGTEDGLSCLPDLCEGGATCEQSDQFRLLFSPDAKNWAAYRLNASNPGQTYYNLVYDASGAGSSDIVLTVTVPYPYVTVGGQPLHIYDADTVGSNGLGCLDPQAAIRSEPLFITLEDWRNGAPGGGEYNLVCDPVDDPGGYGFCSFDVVVLNEEIPPGELLYVNLHLDFGLKGNWVDANPYGADPTGLLEDRYDRHPFISPWGSSDALVNTSTDNGPLALADCQPFWFEHTDSVGPDPLFEDHIENLNIFSKISGVFGQVSCADDGSPLAYHVRLAHPGKGTVATAQADEGGYFVLPYVHHGKPVNYRVEVANDASFSNILEWAKVRVKKGTYADVTFTASNCGLANESWDFEVNYGKLND